MLYGLCSSETRIPHVRITINLRAANVSEERHAHSVVVYGEIFLCAQHLVLQSCQISSPFIRTSPDKFAEAVSGWTIEGMYSDFLIGKRSEDKIVQKESRFETPPPDGSVSEQTVVQKNPLLLHTPPQSSPNQEETIARKKLEQLNNPYSSSPLREHKK